MRRTLTHLKHLRAAAVRRFEGLALRAGYHSRPGFLIIGAQKGGTTSLYFYLAEHPRIVPPKRKEIGFFTPELFADWPEHPNHHILCAPGGSVFEHPSGCRRAVAWYHGHFPWPHRLPSGSLTFEATPDYLYYPAAARRIWEYDREMKLIVLLRDPVDRAFSAWQMYRGYGGYRPLIYAPKRETRSFEDAIRDEIEALEAGRRPPDPGYCGRGLYYEQLTRYFEYFDPRQILILDSEYLRQRTQDALGEVAAFLGLAEILPRAEWKPFHVGEYQSEIPAECLSRLRDFYKPHNQRLYAMLDRDFGW